MRHYATHTYLQAATPAQLAQVPASAWLVADRHAWSTTPEQLAERVRQLRAQLAPAPIRYVVQVSGEGEGGSFPAWDDDSAWERLYARARVLRGLPEVIVDVEPYGKTNPWLREGDAARRARELLAALAPARVSLLGYTPWWGWEPLKAFSSAFPHKTRLYAENPYIRGEYRTRDDFRRLRQAAPHLVPGCVVLPGLSPQARGLVPETTPWESPAEFGRLLRAALSECRSAWLYAGSWWWDRGDRSAERAELAPAVAQGRKARKRRRRG